MIRRPPRSTLTDTLFPSTTLFRSDDELAYACYAANENRDTPYDLKVYGRAYMKRAFVCYREPQVQRAVAMIFKAAGLDPQSRLAGWSARAAFRFIRLRSRMLAA